jgi:regulator of protease activity HflC (stomatin/prohibitin superfamily)
MGAGLVALIVVGVLVLRLLASAIRTVREYQRVVVFRLGRLRGARGPGLVLIIPLASGRAGSACRSTPRTSRRRI